jgi:hypothetical protein
MSETKRGAPTEDGVYDVLVVDCCGHSPEQRVADVKGGVAYWTTNKVPMIIKSPGILAHRKHEPLEIPPLKELRPPPRHREAVVKLVSGGGTLFIDSGPFHAVIIDGRAHYNYSHYCSGSSVADTSNYRELTKAECEAAGYRWPF